MRVLDLFSGIGGFSLGLERTGGFETVAFCEIDPFCRQVLARHWPEVRQYADIRRLTAKRLGADGICVDVICGGFPCQDISVAGTGSGIDGARSGLWREFSRLVGELRPGFVIVENVAALLDRGLDRVLGDLSALGYDAEWHAVSAAHIGAPHVRDRLWLVAYPQREGLSRPLLEWSRLRITTGAASAKLGDRVVSCGPEWPGCDGHLPLGDGVSGGLARKVVKAYGNAVVPQIPEMIGRAILAASADIA